MMDYTTEELVPIVGRLAQTWTGNDHTSISYERAQQLMEAVQKYKMEPLISRL